ncbi:MAG: hypothetical protein ABH868_02135 [bacterium]
MDPSIVIAYFNLGNIYLYRKKLSQAEREFANAARLLEKRPPEEQMRLCEDFNAEFCNHNIEEINVLRSAKA